MAPLWFAVVLPQINNVKFVCRAYICDHLNELRLFERNLADSKHRHSMINPSSTVFDMIVCAQDNLIIMICH